MQIISTIKGHRQINTKTMNKQKITQNPCNCTNTKSKYTNKQLHKCHICNINRPTETDSLSGLNLTAMNSRWGEQLMCNTVLSVSKSLVKLGWARLTCRLQWSRQFFQFSMICIRSSSVLFLRDLMLDNARSRGQHLWDLETGLVYSPRQSGGQCAVSC